MSGMSKPIKRVIVAGVLASTSVCWAGTFTYEVDVVIRYDGSLFTAAWTEPGDPPGLAQCAMNVPTVSEWGMVGMMLLILTAGTLLLTRRRSVRA